MNVHIRDLGPETVKAINERAARHGRSAQAEYRAILDAAAKEEAEPFDWIKVSDEIRARSAGRKHTPSEILVRESRDER
ncbi:hypothetical protein BH10PSE2_BH10PSE2_25170 [soil metagenome]